MYKHFDVVCISVLMLNISLKLAGLNIYFYDVFFLAIKWVQNGVYRNEGFFLLWDWYEVRQVATFYTTNSVMERLTVLCVI